MRRELTSEYRLARLALAGLALILAALFVAWFLRNFERRAIEVEVGYSAAARRNPLLAAERFLDRLGYRVESVSGRGPLRDLPPVGDVLLVNGLGPLNPERRQALRNWIEAGGTLIAVAQEITEGGEPRADDFLGTLGIRLRETDLPAASGDAGRPKVRVEVTGVERPLIVSTPADRYLEDTEDRAAVATPAADGHLRLLQFPLGEGRVTVSADNRFLTNGGIGEHDHAAFLAFIAAPGANGKVWLLYDSALPGLGEILWRVAPQALLAGGLLGLAFAWHLGRRLGPAVPPPRRARRDLLEHLEAGAGFLWREGRADRLAAVARARAERAWLRRHPALRALDQGERARWIAARMTPFDAGDSTPEGAVWRVLYTLPKDIPALIADTDLLQRIWSASGKSGFGWRGRNEPHKGRQSR